MKHSKQFRSSVDQDDLDLSLDSFDKSGFTGLAYIKLFERAVEQIYPASRLSISARVLSHWRKENLLFVERTVGKNKFTLVEYLWLKIVVVLRDFGCSYDIIRRVKNHVFCPLSFKYFDKYEEDKFLAYMSSYFEAVQTDFENGDLNAICTSHLFRMLGFIFFNRQRWALCIASTGDCYWRNLENTQIHPHPHLTITINSLLADLLSRSEVFDSTIRIISLTKKEKKVLEELRSGNVKELTIQFKDNQLESIKIKSSKQIPDAEKRLNELLLQGGYQDICIKTQNGKICHYENTTNIKL